MTEWNWLEKAGELQASGERFALVTVARVSGSTPREVGAKIIFKSNGEFFGTVGGGKLESLVLVDAKACLEKGESGYFSYPLGPKADQCCGGLVEVLIEVIAPSSRLVIFGAGHVGQAVAQVFEGTHFQVFVVDERGEWLEKLPSYCIKISQPWQEFVEKLQWTANDFAVVMTHSHDLDADISAMLVKKPLGYVGLIGSDSKWRRFQARFKKMGLLQNEIDRINCPIGVGDLGKEPKAIAISLAAALLQLRRSKNVSASSRASGGSIDTHRDAEAAYQN